MNLHRYAHINFDKGASSTIIAGKSNFLPAGNWHYIYACYPVLVSTHSGLGTSISTQNLAVSTGRSREYTGTNRYRQWLPQ
jgi:hypothetical protein